MPRSKQTQTGNLTQLVPSFLVVVLAAGVVIAVLGVGAQYLVGVPFLSGLAVPTITTNTQQIGQGEIIAISGTGFTATDTIYGTVPMNQSGTIGLDVVAQDAAGAVAQDLFSVTFAPAGAAHSAHGGVSAPAWDTATLAHLFARG